MPLPMGSFGCPGSLVDHDGMRCLSDGMRLDGLGPEREAALTMTCAAADGMSLLRRRSARRSSGAQMTKKIQLSFSY